MSCKPTYKGVRYNSLEELYNANGVNEQQKQQAQQLYSQYLDTIKKLQEILKDKNIGFEYINFSEDRDSTSYAVPSQEQIHILGSKQDIEGFKSYVKENTSKFTSNNTYHLSYTPVIPTQEQVENKQKECE